MSEPDLTALRAARARLAALREAEGALRRLPRTVMADELGAEACLLAGSAVKINVPCLLCDGWFTMDVPVGAQWAPSAVICGPCDARVTEAVRAECDRRFERQESQTQEGTDGNAGQC